MASRALLRSTASCQPRCFSTAAAAAAETTDATQETGLFEKLLQLAWRKGEEANVAETMEEWRRNGKLIKRFDVVRWVHLSRRRGFYHLALQLSRWMQANDMNVNNADRAIHLDLLAKTEGTDSVESYFSTLQESARTNKTYGALLSCYCRKKDVDKALEVFEKMKELGFTSALNYNNVISLYVRTGHPQKVPALVQEMEERKVSPDMYTYNLLMNSYASLGDINAAEGVLERLERGGSCDWFTYGNLATIYLNAGCVDKANATLNKLENLRNLHEEEAFCTLITLYTRTSDLSGIDKAWGRLKSSFRVPSNKSYLLMLMALSKLGESERLEKCYKEWEAGCKNYDVRLSNVMLESYVSHNMVEEANSLYEGVIKRGKEPNLRMMEAMAKFYIGKGEVDVALRYLEKGACREHPAREKWFPTDETTKMFLKYFEEKRDTKRAEIFAGIMKKVGRLDSAVHEALLGSNVSPA